MTQTRVEVEAAFRADLKALLTKYQAAVEVADPYDGGRVEVYVPAIYNEQHECVREWTVVDLGGWFDYLEE